MVRHSRDACCHHTCCACNVATLGARSVQFLARGCRCADRASAHVRPHRVGALAAGARDAPSTQRVDCSRKRGCGPRSCSGGAFAAGTCQAAGTQLLGGDDASAQGPHPCGPRPFSPWRACRLQRMARRCQGAYRARRGASASRVGDVPKRSLAAPSAQLVGGDGASAHGPLSCGPRSIAPRRACWLQCVARSRQRNGCAG